MTLTLSVLLGIAFLLVLILYFKIQAFLALLMASILIGIFAGMPLSAIIPVVQKGMGDTLGFVATVVGLGALFGAILEQSGGATAIANALLRGFGVKRAPWAMMLTGFIVAIPVFFDVAFIILVPLVYSLQKNTQKPLLLFAIPLLAGLAVTHAFIPPTPGPIAAADILGADLGWVILWGTLVGIPTAMISGPLFATYLARKIPVGLPKLYTPQAEPQQLPSPTLIFGIIGLPIFLIVLSTLLGGEFANVWQISPTWQQFFNFLGHPFTALILANVLAWGLLGIARGFSKQQLLEITTKSLAPAGVIILLTGAGGVLKQMLIETGAGAQLADQLAGSVGSPIVFAFLVAVIVRVMQGSATVAMITAAGMSASLLENLSLSKPMLALVVIAISAGATTFSHVNDSAFWLVNRYLGLTEKQTFMAWSTTTTLLAFVAFLLILLLSIFV